MIEDAELRPKARKEIGVYRVAIRAATTAQKRLGTTLVALNKSDLPGTWKADTELARAYDSLATTIHNLEACILRVQDFEEQVARGLASAP